ncbi:MAG TPA: cupin domain-containing protein [Vicinamibacterales bacterium]|nr:cupin domain-containing protein [Vicinamibacterales bacterium]
MTGVRTLVLFVALAAPIVAHAQAPAPAPTDRTRATHFRAADLQAALAKLPADRPASSVRVFTLDPYSVAVEQRQPLTQGASSHADRAELFYVIDGAGTLLTGGTISDGKPSGTNTQGTTIAGGTRIEFAKGDFIMVPSGVPHQFVDLKAPVQVMSMYLPNVAK